MLSASRCKAHGFKGHAGTRQGVAHGGDDVSRQGVAHGGDDVSRQGVAHGGDDVSNPQNKPYQDLMEAFLRPGPNTALDLLPLGLYRRHDGIGENYWSVLSLDALLWYLGAPRICVCF